METGAEARAGAGMGVLAGFKYQRFPADDTMITTVAMMLMTMVMVDHSGSASALSLLWSSL